MYQGQALKKFQQDSFHSVVDAKLCKLVRLPMVKELDNISIANGTIEASENETRNELANKAIDIIQQLRNCLDQSYDKDIDARLEQLYDHVGFRLFQAMSQNDIEALDGVSNLLAHIHKTWLQVGVMEDQAPVSTVEQDVQGLQKSVGTYI